MGVSQADNSVNILRNVPISNPKPELLNVNAYSKFDENSLSMHIASLVKIPGYLVKL